MLSDLREVVSFTHNYMRAPEPLRPLDSHFQLLESEGGWTLFLHLTNISSQIIRKELFSHALMLLETDHYTPRMTWIQTPNEEAQHTTYTTSNTEEVLKVNTEEVLKVISTAQNKLDAYMTMYRIAAPWKYREK
jgi:hypothetical protein